MYLKFLEIIGFKSFADRTRLQFEPGMIAIVGPNGCGKSNVSDAIRWVLGEQRPSALRCGKMQDLVFSGADDRKPLGMAEVSITFADCEEKLGTAYNEVTITRRLFRSGESQYYLNKTACRLKDIQRLFMGTGIGTTSYSVMAQGQIDAILSSKPEDRRAVFEEAAGVTKFKADRKEALRKLDQTDANLLRLADVIREVKQQVGSLQRQVGKAKRHRELTDERRTLDLFVARHKIDAITLRLTDLDAQLADFESSNSGHQTALTQAEQATAACHEELHRIEQQIGAFQESSTQAESKLLRAQEVIRVNEQRIAEYKAWAQRDAHEVNENQHQIQLLTDQRETLATQLEEFTNRHDSAAGTLDELQYQHDEYRQTIDRTRRDLQNLRDEALQRERRAAQIQVELSEHEALHSARRLQRERLNAEHDQLAGSLAQIETAGAEAAERCATLHEEETAHAERLQSLEDQLAEAALSLKEKQHQHQHLRSEIAAMRARLETLGDREELDAGQPEGNRQLLAPDNPLHLQPGVLLGSILDHLTVPPDLRLAAEAALRPWMDALLVRDEPAATDLLNRLHESSSHAAARLVIASVANPNPCHVAEPPPLPRLLDRLETTPGFRDAAERLLGHIYLAPDINAIPFPLPAGCAVVTPQGMLFHAQGAAEVWNPDTPVATPLARRMLIQELTGQLQLTEPQAAALERETEDLHLRQSTLGDTLRQTRGLLDQARRQTAQKQGEAQMLQRDGERTRTRLAALKNERDQLLGQTNENDAKFAQLKEELEHLIATRQQHVERSAVRSGELEEKELTASEISQRLTEARITATSMKQQIDHIRLQDTTITQRIDELTRIIQGRSQGIASYDEGVLRMTEENESLSGDLDSLREEVRNLHAVIEDARYDKAEKRQALTVAETALATARAAFDAIRDKKGVLDIEHAEQRMRKENILEKVYNDYGLSPEEFDALPPPQWPGDAPAIPDAETRIAQLNNSIQALGPVNLVAIEELAEKEERYQFLTDQENDLRQAKTQVTQLIQSINTQTGEMFKATFEEANTNFATMFTKLFNGGEARLILIENLEDPLECGVDVIARPPGKRPQTISLLSGGERTMTAVALLFSIYMIKPSPFAMLDELDAALDDSNIGRFVNALRDFLSQSQFLIITHNQHTIASADIVYGVTMPQKGISKTISIRLKEVGHKNPGLGTAQPDAPPPEEPKKRRRKKKPDEEPQPELPIPAPPES